MEASRRGWWWPSPGHVVWFFFGLLFAGMVIPYVADAGSARLKWKSDSWIVFGTEAPGWESLSRVCLLGIIGVVVCGLAWGAVFYASRNIRNVVLRVVAVVFAVALVPGVPLGAALLFNADPVDQNVTVDLPRRTIVSTRRYLLVRSTETRTLSFGDIARVDLDYYDGGESAPSSHVSVLSRGGERIQLSTGAPDAQAEIAALLADRIGVGLRRATH